jgi:hypothetical protein
LPLPRRDGRSITSGWLQLKSSTSAPRCSAARGVDDRFADRRRLAFVELVVQRERDPERRNLHVGVEHLDEAGFGDRGLCFCQPESTPAPVPE